MKDLLICGTENGYIKLLDINSEKILVKARVNSYYISDIKYHQGRLISLDWFGNILHWKLLEVRYSVLNMLNYREWAL